MDKPCKRDFRPSAAQSRPVLASESTAAHRPDSWAPLGARKTHRWPQRRPTGTSRLGSTGESGDSEESVRESGCAGDPIAEAGAESGLGAAPLDDEPGGFGEPAFRESPPGSTLRSTPEPT